MFGWLVSAELGAIRVFRLCEWEVFQQRKYRANILHNVSSGHKIEWPRLLIWWQVSKQWLSVLYRRAVFDGWCEQLFQLPGRKVQRMGVSRILYELRSWPVQIRHWWNFVHILSNRKVQSNDWWNVVLKLPYRKVQSNDWWNVVHIMPNRKVQSNDWWNIVHKLPHRQISVDDCSKQLHKLPNWNISVADGFDDRSGLRSLSCRDILRRHWRVVVRRMSRWHISS